MLTISGVIDSNQNAGVLTGPVKQSKLVLSLPYVSSFPLLASPYTKQLYKLNTVHSIFCQSVFTNESVFYLRYKGLVLSFSFNC